MQPQVFTQRLSLWAGGGIGRGVGSLGLAWLEVALPHLSLILLLGAVGHLGHISPWATAKVLEAQADIHMRTSRPLHPVC